MARCVATLTVLLAGAGALAGDQEGKEAAKAGDPLRPRVKMETTLGDIVLELDAEKAPVTVLNFVRYAEDKYYEGTVFHRVMKGFMIQAGGFTPEIDKKEEGLRDPIVLESNKGLSNVAGTIAMARTAAPDSAQSQFFINLQDNSRMLDYKAAAQPGYAVFGRVVEGMDTVEKIRNAEVQVHPKYRTPDGAVTPVQPVVIKSVRLVSEFDRTKPEAAAKAAEAAKAAAKEAEKKAKEERMQALRDHVKKLEAETGKKAAFTNSGLAYIVLQDGTGGSPAPTSKVKVHYTGWLLDGTKFDSSVDRGQPAEFPLNGVIKGWTEGVGLMKVGAKHKLIIPPDLAYGEAGRPSIPPNSILIFDVELLDIVSP